MGRILAAAVLGAVVYAAPAAADDCAALLGTVAGGECRIATPVTAAGSYHIATGLRLLPGAQLVVPPLASGNSLTLEVAGAVEIEAGAAIVGDADLADGVGAAITITAAGDIRLRGGDGAASVSADSHLGSCAGAGKAGAITLRSTGGDIRIDAGARVETSGQCPAGEIRIVTDDGDIHVDGEVEAASGSSGGGSVTLPRGGPITIASACALRVGAEGFVSSSGLGPGADLVHLESGCDTVIHGRVESVAGVAPDPAPNRCAGTFRPGKPAGATACVEIWVGGDLLVDSESGNGFVVVDTGPPPPGSGVCCAWADLIANGDVTVAGPPTAQSRAPYALSARQTSTNAMAGLITVKSLGGKVTARGRAFNADAITLPGGVGGTITLQAGGTDTGGNIDLNDSSTRAVGGSVAPGAGGQILIRSFNGQITGGAGQPTDPTKGHINASGFNAGVVFELKVCNGFLYTGQILPPVSPSAPACGGAPAVESYVQVPVYRPLPALTVTGGTFVADGSPHPATVSVLGVDGEPLGPVTVTYNGSPAPPIALGTYEVVASFAGNELYRPVSGTATIFIIDPASPQPTLTVTGGTFTYDGTPHPASVVLGGTGGEPLGPVTVTYNGSLEAPVNAGTYAVVASFAGNAEYRPVADATATITITRATPVVEVVSFSVVYDGNAHPATGAVRGVGGAVIGTPVFTYNGSPAVPQHLAGDYAVIGTFAGDVNYTGATGTGTIVITKATPRITVTGGTFVYDGTPHPATATVLGVGVIPEVLGPVTFTYDGAPAAPVDPGSYAVVGAYAGNTNYLPVAGTAALEIVIGPNTPPVCAAARPSAGPIWPPNHRMVAVGILDVHDADGDATTVRITRVLQSEPTNTRGDGNTAVDGGGIGTATALVRAERGGSGRGRVYEVQFSASDGKGGACEGAVIVSVPHDNGKRGAARDTGVRYDSTVAGGPRVR